ncbi:sulfotransferase [Alteromonas hispanica]|uniref:Uncharacterized protein n=1 Tax=Alteromonas hispanica TaxID=315421 RepID=A0A6L9MTN8_9ALTE|nr:hypothetical protein [Alteromonas hispanica]
MIKKPIFIIGTQRSGTTLLTRMLSAHPELFIQNEMGDWGVFHKPYAPEELHERIAKKLCSHGVNLKELQEKKKRWGWKDPMLTPHIFELAASYPDAKFIVLVRDPRAVVASYIENAWGLGTNAYTGALRWKKEVAHQLTLLNVYPDRCLLLKYESLIESTVDCLEDVVEFIGVDYDELMLNYHQKPLEFSQNASNANTRKPINQNSLNKWKRTLSRRQIGTINAVCKSLMQQLHFLNEIEQTHHPKTLEKYGYLIHQALVGEYQLQYQLRKARRARQKK